MYNGLSLECRTEYTKQIFFARLLALLLKGKCHGILIKVFPEFFSFTRGLIISAHVQNVLFLVKRNSKNIHLVTQSLEVKRILVCVDVFIFSSCVFFISFISICFCICEIARILLLDITITMSPPRSLFPPLFLFPLTKYMYIQLKTVFHLHSA